MSRNPVLAIAAALGAVLVMPAVAAPATASSANGAAHNSAPLIGVSTPNSGFVAAVEQATGRQLGVIRTFHRWGQQIGPTEKSYAASGHALMPSFMVAGGKAGPTYSQIARGRDDAWLAASLRAYDSLGVKVWWIPQQEINKKDFGSVGTPAQAKAFLLHIAKVAGSLHLQHVVVTPALICARFAKVVDSYLPSPYPFTTLGMIAANANFGVLDPALGWLAAHPGIRLVIAEFEGSPPPRGSVANTREALVNFSAWAKANSGRLDAASYFAGHIALSASNGTLPLFVNLANTAPFH